MQESFKTKVDLSLMLSKKNEFVKENENYDVLTQTVEITWNLGIDVRSWGLKDIGMSADDQKITVLLNIWGDDSDTEREIVLDVKDVEIVRNSTEFYSLAPQELEFYNNKWRLIF